MDIPDENFSIDNFLGSFPSTGVLYGHRGRKEEDRRQGYPPW